MSDMVSKPVSHHRADPPNRAAGHFPVTQDGRYFVVRGRLWRMANPALAAQERDALVHALMDARRNIAAAKRSDDAAAEMVARHRVDDAKRALGERGPVWWHDGAPDYNRHMVRTSPYARWFAELEAKSSEAPDAQADRT
jgi:hypothetical protein